jgi:putative Mg2+ transporter-C (MgtC) family protein
VLDLLTHSATPTLLPTAPVPEWIVALRLGVAVLMGMAIGWERAMAEKPADARTMALVAAGAAGFTLLGVQIAASVTPDTSLSLDPTRIIAYIISGVGFLGAGAILHSKKSVTGLTTAASIWTAAAIGAACGLGAFTIAVGLFLVAVAVLWVPWVKRFPMNGNGHRRDPDDG